MEFLAEQEPRNPSTGTIVPVVLLIPGTRPPQTSRVYLFLNQEKLRLTTYIIVHHPSLFGGFIFFNPLSFSLLDVSGFVLSGFFLSGFRSPFFS